MKKIIVITLHNIKNYGSVLQTYATQKVLREIEYFYKIFTVRDLKLRPEDARAVLPLCLKSELYMTANLRELRHILKLRTDKAAHPQMRFIMNKILAVFKEKLPVIVEDIT